MESFRKEKEKLKTTKCVFQGCARNNMKNNTSRELLQIQPTMLEDLRPDDNLSSGRFGTVCLKKFRSTPVAVKYLGSSSVKEVQREASFLDKCCHINLPIIFGVNTMQKPYFIVAEFYGKDRKSVV